MIAIQGGTIVTMAGAVCVFLDTAPDGFQITPQALSAVMTARTKLIILNSPNNPTGSVCTQESLQAVHDAVAGKPVFILCDDVYARLVYAPCPMFARYRDLRSQILVVQSFSKPYAMTGWRMGYLMGDEPVIRQLALLHACKKVAKICGIEESGYRIASNCGRDAAQSVQHLHVHVLGGGQLSVNMA